MALLQKAKDFFKRRETRIEKTWSDRGGDYAFLVYVPGAEGHRTPMVVTAKRYLRQRGGVKVTSFMKGRVVKRATAMDARLLQFVAQPDAQFVFDAQGVLEYGVPSGGGSKRAARGEAWLDIPTAWSVSLQDFADRRAAPRADPVDGDPRYELLAAAGDSGQDGHVQDQDADGQSTLEGYDDA